MMYRTCTCKHGFPLCACSEGVAGGQLLRRSRWLSSLAGWPGKITEEGLAVAQAQTKTGSAPVVGDCGCGTPK